MTSSPVYHESVKVTAKRQPDMNCLPLPLFWVLNPSSLRKCTFCFVYNRGEQLRRPWYCMESSLFVRRVCISLMKILVGISRQELKWYTVRHLISSLPLVSGHFLGFLNAETLCWWIEMKIGAITMWISPTSHCSEPSLWTASIQHQTRLLRQGRSIISSQGTCTCIIEHVNVGFRAL